MYTRAAQLISLVLHPLLLPTFAFIIVLYVTPLSILTIQEDAKWLLLSVIFILTFLAPLTGILVFYTAGGIKSLFLNELKDRRLPLMVACIFYMLATLLFGLGEAFSRLPFLVIFMSAITICTVLMTIISLYWKISTHSTGVGGLLGFLFGLSFRFSDERFLYPIVICMIISGILMSAQLYLNTHTSEQVQAGFALGFVINSGVLFYFL